MVQNQRRTVTGKRSTPTSTRKPIASLALAYQLTQKASKVGFDWPDIQGVLKKLDEELMEFGRPFATAIQREPKKNWATSCSFLRTSRGSYESILNRL
jgi:uncharacterized protein YabN with tetrapyrrole methylase and pyrophosphatase domain